MFIIMIALQVAAATPQATDPAACTEANACEVVQDAPGMNDPVTPDMQRQAAEQAAEIDRTGEQPVAIGSPADARDTPVVDCVSKKPCSASDASSPDEDDAGAQDAARSPS